MLSDTLAIRFFYILLSLDIHSALDLYFQCHEQCVKLNNVTYIITNRACAMSKYEIINRMNRV